MNPSIADFKRAAKHCIEAAKQALKDKRLQLGCYLVHVGIECLLKARLLFLARVHNLEALQPMWAKSDFDEVFRGRSGHDLRRLADKANLRRLLEAQPKRETALLDGPGWKRLCGSDRPYSVRYHWETTHQSDADAELTLGVRLYTLLDRELVAS